MISEALGMRVEGYGRLGGDRVGVVMVCMRVKNERVGHMPGDAGVLPQCKVNTLVTPDYIAVQVHSSGYGRSGIGRSSWKSLDTGHYEKAPVRCPCCWLHSMVLHRCLVIVTIIISVIVLFSVISVIVILITIIILIVIIATTRLVSSS